MKNNFREYTINSLKKIQTNNAYSNIVINKDIKSLDEKYHNLYRKSVLGVIENLYFEDYVIDKLSSVKSKKMQTEVLVTLRLAIYQIFFLDNSKENIIVNESVEYIKNKVNIKASKFVNAILRNVLRNKETILNEINSLDTVKKLSIKYSYPEWLISLWSNQYGSDKIEDVLIANNNQAPLNIRVNTTIISKEELKKTFDHINLEYEDCKIADKGMIISNPEDIENMESYKSGLFSIQSESSMLVGQVLNPKPNSLVIDVCSAPGGKTMDIAERLNNTGKVVSRDLYSHKTKLIENEKNRLHLENITVEVKDALIYDESLEGKADYCVIDAPCSGLGIIRRKPEIKYNKKEEDMKNISHIQYKILLNASKYLKKDGIMVYSTCTTATEENLGVVNRFIENNSNYELVDISEETKNIFDTSAKGYIEIIPHIHHMDGFFIAKIRRLS